MRISILLLLLFQFSFSQVRVIDGDTFYYNGEKIRLAYIDAPEIKQPQGTLSKNWLERFLSGKDITISVINIDKYQRKICRVWVSGKEVSEEMVKQGYAWNYYYYSKSDLLENLQEKARTKGLGIWKFKNNIRPKDWRESHGI